MAAGRPRPSEPAASHAWTARAVQAAALLIQANGKIVLGGDSRQNASAIDFALARYDSNGRLDQTFGEQGKVLTSVSPSNARDTSASRARCVGAEPALHARRY